MLERWSFGYICHYLNPVDLLRIGQVNREIRTISELDVNWKPFVTIKNEDENFKAIFLNEYIDFHHILLKVPSVLVDYIEMHPEIVTKVDQSGNMLIHQIILMGSAPCLKIALDIGGCLQYMNTPNRRGDTPIILAVKIMKLDMVTILCNTGRVNFEHTNVEGRTCCDYSIEYCQYDCNDCSFCNVLFKSGGDLCRKYESQHIKSPANERDIDEFGFLVDENTINKSFKDFDKYTRFRTTMRDREKFRFNSYENDFKEADLSAWITAGLGVPHVLRMNVWRKLLLVDNVKANNEYLYEKLLKQKTSPDILASIDLDIPRTFSHNIYFQGRFCPNQIKLFNILRAYMNYNKEMYSQSLPYVVGFFLLVFNDEEDVFFALKGFCENPKWGLGAILENVKETDGEFNYLFENMMPELDLHFVFQSKYS